MVQKIAGLDETTARAKVADEKSVATPMRSMIERFNADDLWTNLNLVMTFQDHCLSWMEDERIIRGDLYGLHEYFCSYARSREYQGDVFGRDEFEYVLREIRPVTDKNRLHVFVNKPYVILGPDEFIPAREFVTRFRQFESMYDFSYKISVENIVTSLGRYGVQMSKCTMNVDGEEKEDEYLLGINIRPL